MPKIREKRKTRGTSVDDVRAPRNVSLSSATSESTLPRCLGVLNRPNAKWREFGLRINFEPILDATSVETAERIARGAFYEYHERAVGLEEERVQKRLEKLKLTKKGKRPTSRPTDKALSMMTEDGLVCNAGLVFGHVAGVAIGDEFEYKVQMKLIGLHRIVMSGIDYIGKGVAHPSSPPLAVSIVVAGWYEDDDDSQKEMLYTGQGGNDLLGRRLQIADQQLNRGNLALYNNAVYGVPVRVIKKNGKKFIYDGLWDVLQMIKKKGAEGYIVYQFRLTRCPGQEPSNTRQVRFKEGSAMKTSALASITAKDEICSDYSRGLSAKPVSVTNNVDDELPVGLIIDDLCSDARNRKEWKASEEPFEFGIQTRYHSQVPIVNDHPEIPEQYKDAPHDYLTELNHGITPYKKEGTLHQAMCLVYECGPWLRCVRGEECRLCVTSKQPQWRFQIFKTRSRGWGIKTLDTIPNGSFVLKYIGEVYRVEEAGLDGDDMYSFDMVTRPDYTDENIWLPVQRTIDVRYAITGWRYGNLFRFINHSCDPNCFIQPTLSWHLDRSRPDVNIFAMRTILPGEEISYDYGRDYIETLMGSDCRCGTACCIKRAVEAVET